MKRIHVQGIITKENTNKLFLWLLLLCLFAAIFISPLKEAFESISWELNNPYAMDSTIFDLFRSEEVSFTIIQALFMTFTLIVLLFFVLRRVIYLLYPRSSSMHRTLALYGEFEQVSSQIESQVMHDIRHTIGDVIFTKSWLINTHKYFPCIVPLDQIVKVYNNSEHILAQGIPIGKKYIVGVKTAQKKSYNIRLKSKDELQQTLAYLTQQ